MALQPLAKVVQLIITQKMDAVTLQIIFPSIPIQGLYHAPVILPESGHSCGIRWNPVELFLAESPAKIAIPGTIYSSRIEPFRNWHRNGPGMDRNGIRWNAVFFFFLHV